MTPVRGSSQLAIHAAYVAGCAVAAALTEPWLMLVLSGAMGTVMLPWIAYRESRRFPERMTPLGFYLAWYAIGLGPATLYMGVRMRTELLLPFAASALTVEDLVPGVIVFALGTLTLHAGMEWFRPPETPRTFVRAVPENLWILGGLALIGLYAQLRSLEGSYGTLVQPVLYAPHALLTLFAIRNRRDLGLGRAPYVLLLAAGTAVLVAIGWRTGAKTGIMLSFLPVVWGMLLHRRRRWMLAPMGAFLLIGYLTVVAPVIMTYRQMNSPGSTDVAGISESLDILESHGDVEQESITGLPAGVEGLFDRQFESSAVAFIYRDVSYTGHMGGETMSDIFVALIPRFLYPDKPELTRGRWFHRYTGLTADVDSTNLGMTAAGEWYWNFGWAGLVLGMFLTGALLSGMLWRLAGSNPASDPIRMLIYVTLLFHMNQLSDATNPLLGCVSHFLLFGFLLVVAGLRTSRWRGIRGARIRVALR